MYLQIGGIAIPFDDVYAILDLDKASTSMITKEYIQKQNLAKKLIEAGTNFPRSIIITQDSVYISDYTVSTLQKRYSQGLGA